MAKTEDKSVATEAQNDKLQHSDKRAPETTRDDLLDLGVPMLAGSPDEPQGPEDALGAGPKRGDYTARIGGESYNPHTTEAIPADEQEPGGPTMRSVPQRPRVAEIGDAKGLKGGVETDPLSRGGRR